MYPKSPNDVAAILEGGNGPLKLIVTVITAGKNPRHEDTYESYDLDDLKKKAAKAWKMHNMGANTIESVKIDTGNEVIDIPNPAGPSEPGDSLQSHPDQACADQIDFGQYIEATMRENNLDMDDNSRVTDLERGYSFNPPSKLFMDNGGNKHKAIDRIVQYALELRSLDIRFGE